MDANIFVCVYSKGKEDLIKRKHLKTTLDLLSKVTDVELCTSVWTITEVVKVLIIEKKYKTETVDKIQVSLNQEKRIMGVKFKYIDIGKDKDYDFNEFFYHIREGLLSFKSHLADVMHAIIMQNNKVERVLTFDTTGFVNIPGLIILNPEVISDATKNLKG